MQEEIFEKYPIPKAYFKLALPVVFSMVISLVYNMVDTYFIAGTGNTDLVAGVALGSPIFTLMIALGDIFGLGGSSFISRLLEKKIRGRKADQRIQLLWRDRQRCCSCGCTDDLQKSGIGTSGCKRGHLGVCVTVLYLYCTGCAVYHCCADTVQSVTNRRICDGFDGWFCTWRSCKHYSGSDHDLCTGLGCGRRSYSDRDRKCLYRYFLCMVSY